ncbi:MAG: amidohydrolase [Pelolinea sp.]|jgi:5-methylthioadenosine/S-adenosylhomocysteine deaminase|nr:amidohydrolase [Pelolinea sp.]
MTNLLIKKCDVLSFAGGKAHVETKQDIAIQDESISAIEKTGTLQEGNFEQCIDAGGMLAVPGFINTHAHVPMVLFRNLAEDVTISEWFNDYIWPMESNLTEEDVYWGAQLGMAEMIENGITCVADHYFHMDEVAKAVEMAGMRANLVWAVFAHQGEEMLDKTIDFTRRWQGKADGRITTWLGPHAPYTTNPDFLKLCAQKAQKNGLGIHIHVSETAAQVDLSLKEYGITPVQQVRDCGILDVPTILAHVVDPRGEDFDILASHDTGIAQAPKTYLKSGMGLAPIHQYREHGIPFGLATDGAVSNNTLDIMEQMRLLALFGKYQTMDSTCMKLEELMEITFHGGAKVMHLPEKIGDLKPGMLADITLIRQDGLNSTPKANSLAYLLYCAKSSDVDTVLCNGKVLMQGRKLLTLDKARIQQEVQSRLQRLSQRMPNERIAFYPA